MTTTFRTHFTFRAACQRWPGTPITLRQGARVIEDNRRLRAVWRAVANGSSGASAAAATSREGQIALNYLWR